MSKPPSDITCSDGLTHLDAEGRAHMVDVGEKGVTEREARAVGRVRVAAATLDRLARGDVPKGDVLAVARVAGIQAAKKTSELIPLCHHLALSHCGLAIDLDRDGSALRLEATVRCRGRTGVEMEALTAVSIAALTLYDMLKAIDRDMTIDGVCLVEKRGGRSGHYRREG